MADDRHRVVWYEGMALDPHHMQQYERYAQARLDGRLRGLSRTGWGLHHLEVDQDRLANGEFALVQCVGVLPDGQPFNAPDTDPVPQSRAVRTAFEPTRERLGVYLALPAVQAGGAVVQREAGTGEPRYLVQTATVRDENTGADERALEVARPNLLIRFEGEPLDAYTLLQVARLRRTADGSIRLDEAFVPTCTTLAASARLRSLTRRLVERLTAKVEQFGERRDGVFAQRELTPRDVSAVGLLAGVSAALPRLSHHLAVGSHPQALFEALLDLAGWLTAYLPTAGVRPGDLPAYTHEALTDCFGALDDQINRMLGGAAPRTGYVRLPLVRKDERLFETALNGRVGDRDRLFLAARSDAMPEHRLASELPRLLRIAAPENIDSVLRSYTRALPIEFTSRLPAGVPIDDRASYFELRKLGPFWEAIEASEALAVFVPSELEGVTVELVAVGT